MGTRLMLLTLCFLAVFASTGCVRVYHPMSNLHRPVVVDPQAPNFAGTSMTVHCVPADLLSQTRASLLCQRVTNLFENQGAVVRTIAAVSEPLEDPLDDELPGFGSLLDPAAPKPVVPAAAPVELYLELRARKIHQANHPFSWLACLATFTVIPGITETTFAQDVVIRDGTNFPLVKETLQGRMVTRFGAGAWIANMLLDRVWRKRQDRVIGVSITKDLSRDLYGQLSQSMYNAKIQAQVLQRATPRGSRK